MAKFKDGAGVEREIRIDNGLLEDVIEKHGIELDVMFNSDQAAVVELIYWKPRKFGGILTDLSLPRLAGDEAKAFYRGLNAEAMESARQAFLEDLSSFFLPLGRRGTFLKAVEAFVTSSGLLGGSNKPTELEAEFSV